VAKYPKVYTIPMPRSIVRHRLERVCDDHYKVASKHHMTFKEKPTFENIC
jgi:hypothetical protein